MASIYDEMKRKQAQSSAASPGSASKYTGMVGLSAGTQQNLGKLQQGYKPSDAVNQAQNYLSQVNAQKPADYQSAYSPQLNDIYNKIMNRGEFKYDLNGDALYQQYKDQYMRQGQQAMMDTMGQAAALTGGYGSSYASTAGNQAYQQYLTQLNSIVPQLYDKAAARYDQAGSNLLNQYNVAQTADSADYQKYQDALSQYNTDRSYALNQYGTLYGNDYQKYQDHLSYWQGLAGTENSDYYNAQNLAWQQEQRDAAAAAAAASSGWNPPRKGKVTAKIDESFARWLQLLKGNPRLTEK